MSLQRNMAKSIIHYQPWHTNERCPFGQASLQGVSGRRGSRLTQMFENDFMKVKATLSVKCLLLNPAFKLKHFSSSEIHLYMKVNNHKIIPTFPGLYYQ